MNPTSRKKWTSIELKPLIAIIKCDEDGRSVSTKESDKCANWLFRELSSVGAGGLNFVIALRKFIELKYNRIIWKLNVSHRNAVHRK